MATPTVPVETALIDARWKRYIASDDIDKRKAELPSESTRKQLPGYSFYYYELNLQIDGRDSVLKYTFDVPDQDSKPSNGWPLCIAFHGGGDADDPDVNNQSWMVMQSYYLESAKNIPAIYVAPRGIPNSNGRDTWDLHFTQAGYTLLERLVENLILFKDVDSNRVYMTGFSAGGDAISRLSTRLSARLAAVNLSAGHDGENPLVNLTNVPIGLQAGESDNKFQRSFRMTVCGAALEKYRSDTLQDAELKQRNLQIYQYDVFLHPTPTPDGRPPGNPEMWKHNSWETVASLRTSKQPVVNSWQGWQTTYKPDDYLDSSGKMNWQTGLTQQYETIDKDTNPIRWMKNYVRNPVPQLVVWDLTVRAPTTKSPKSTTQNYWLDIDNGDSVDYGSSVKAWYDLKINTITVLSAKNFLRILLRSDMVDYSVPLTVRIPGQKFDNGRDSVKLFVKLDQAVMKRTFARNDKNLTFSANITLTQSDSGWRASTDTNPVTYQTTATVTMRTGRLDIFGINADDCKMVRRWMDNATWSFAEETLGTQKFITAPTACAVGPKQMTVVGVGIDGQCYYRQWKDDQWQQNKSGKVDWQALPFKIQTGTRKFVTPVTVIKEYGPSQRVYAIGITLDGECWQTTVGSSDPSNPDQWISRGVVGQGDPIVGPVSAISVKDGLHMTALNTSQIAMYKFWDGKIKTDWRSFLTPASPPAVTGPPALTSYDGIRVDSFSNTTDGAMLHKWTLAGTPSQWSDPVSIRGSSGFKGVPAAISPRPKELYHKIYCLGYDSQVYEIVYNGSNYSAPARIPDPNGGTSLANSPNCVSWAPSRVDILCQDYSPDHTLQVLYWTDVNQRGWGRGWISIGSHLRNDL